jgi:hypothetical protein
VWLPVVRPVYSSGDEQPVKAPPSSEHSNSASSSLAVKLNVAIVSNVGFAGWPWSVVSGATVSAMTFHA